MCNKKMIHVFNEMVVKAGRNVDTADLCFINGGVSATFFCAQQAHHAAHAINNHDRLTEENKQLREMLEKYIAAADSGSFGRMGQCYKDAKNLLNK